MREELEAEWARRLSEKEAALVEALEEAGLAQGRCEELQV
jgi:hypothetical protein